MALTIVMFNTGAQYVMDQSGNYRVVDPYTRQATRMAPWQAGQQR